VNTPKPSADEVRGGKSLPPSRKRPRTSHDEVLEKMMTRVVESTHSTTMIMKDEEEEEEEEKPSGVTRDGHSEASGENSPPAYRALFT